MVIHTVQRGDSVYSIAARYGVPAQRILEDNNISDPGRLVIGQALVVITDNVNYTVMQGDSLYSIANEFNTTVQNILDANPGLSQDLMPGQVISVPSTGQGLRAIDVNGYAFPTIRQSVLTDTLPNLTFISIFSYQVRADGSLIPIEDAPVIQPARQAGVAPLMVITNIVEGGSFDSDLASSILGNRQVRQTVIENVVTTMNTKNYYGLDIDFEYVYPSDRENYNAFLREVTERLHPLGYTVTTALAPKVDLNQRGLLYEAHDYAFHGQYADHIILMTYEWGYTYGQPQAVAPLNLVERVIQTALQVIPSEKILMGIPNYGYDWTLPFRQGTAARSITLNGAVELARNVGAEIRFDERAQSPFFNYYDSSGRQHVVWFEDARSIEAKLRLVNKYNLAGVSYWTINTFFRPNWLVLRSMYNISRVL
ncbi:MAG: Spore germination protein YaaH [Firmicutes bacterium ADurb.Bin182]|nr:MAG: Spore germination protein YaaH [Firmicutes bacterium ADurb.Bin182]